MNPIGSLRKKLVAFGLLLVLLCRGLPLHAQAHKPATIDDLGWLAGAWASHSSGVESEEHWLPPKGGVMLGLNRTVREGRRASFEFLRIAATTNGVSYFASPQGRPSTEFPLKEHSERRIVFENSRNDFPQRIIYRLEDGRVLHARIEGIVNGSPRHQEWRWEKAGPKP